MRRAAIAALLLTGCVADQGTVAVEPLDAAFYAANVQPVVGPSCGSLDCHGVGLRPLRIYAEDGLRIDDGLRGAPISDEEIGWNVAAFGGVDPEPSSADTHVALSKPLAVGAGGLHHLGDPVFASEGDPGYRCLRGWLAADPSALDACAEAEAALEP
ncbi:MAG TPA: hypothetical protein RMH99_18755 [Sandaracinaceae bacterium LLY-WYZ-13_1]|nr:hypothetical protein [Sandaracinaceae bacterium LLY-WYZ-13_1]